MESENASKSLKPVPGSSGESPELRIVLIGGRDSWSNITSKSVTGNTILGKRVFETTRRTAQCVVGQQEVHGRHVTVVNTPDWWWCFPQKVTPELDKIEIMNSVHLCPPGPHAFLLVIPADLGFSQLFKPSLEEHLQLFHKEMLNHTLVLFSVDAPCSLKRLISWWPALQWIVEQCGNRTHVLNTSEGSDRAQVEVLLNKIDAMVAENSGNHYSADRADGDSLREKIQVIVERASKRKADVETQRRKLRALIEGGKTPPAHFRLVMVGGQSSGKSSAGNTILGEDAFPVKRQRNTVYCGMRDSTVAGRQLTVVDSPGWINRNTLQDTSEMDKLEIENSMYLCPPGPHAVLLVVDMRFAFNTFQRAVQQHMSLFSDEVWMHTIVLFTRGDFLGVKTIEECIESEEGLQWLVEKCGNRYHVLDNMNHTDERQVTELLEKIEEMWAGNRDPHYEVNMGRGEELKAKKEAGDMMTEKIRRTTQRQSRVLKELFRGETQSPTDMRVILVGREYSGKSMAGNTILSKDAFDTAWLKKEYQNQRGRAMSVKHQQKNSSGPDITVVEAPGWSKNMLTPDVWLRDEVLRSISMCDPGPHAFLLVISTTKAFTEQDLKVVVDLMTPFGERVWRHCMVLFTIGDWLADRSIEEHITREGKALQWLVKKCGNRYHVLTSIYSFKPNDEDVKELFQKIIDMITRNKGHYFTIEDKKKWTNKLGLTRQVMLTEEEWTRREQELIDCMMKAVAEEPEEPTLPFVRMAESMDGTFFPYMSAGAPSEAGSTYWSQKHTSAKVSEWLNFRTRSSDITSGVSSMSLASSVSRLNVRSLLYDNLLPKKQFSSEEVKMMLDIVLHSRVSTDIVGTQRRHSS